MLFHFHRLLSPDKVPRQLERPRRPRPRYRNRAQPRPRGRGWLLLPEHRQRIPFCISSWASGLTAPPTALNTGGGTRREERCAELQRPAPITPLLNRLPGRGWSPGDTALSREGPVLRRPTHSVPAISSPQSGINVQRTPQKTDNTSHNANNLQPL